MRQLRTAELYRDAQRRLIAVEVLDVKQAGFSHGGQVYASMTPLAVVVCQPDGKEVMLVDAANRLEDLQQQYPGLDALIGEACRFD